VSVTNETTKRKMFLLINNNYHFVSGAFCSIEKGNIYDEGGNQVINEYEMKIDVYRFSIAFYF
jgi:hypothetical protein